jgi:hypothetical protein
VLNLKRNIMLARFLKLCLLLFIVILVPYYLPTLILGEYPDLVIDEFFPIFLVIWCIGVIMIGLTFGFITLLGVAYQYVVNGFIFE